MSAKNKHIILLLFFLVSFSKLFAQFTAAQKARTVINLAKEIKWENENQILKYKIGVFEDKDSLFNNFTSIAESGQLLKSKNIEVYQFNKLEEIGDYLDDNDLQIFYLQGRALKYQDTISRLLDNRNILIVFDNADNKDKCVINLLNNEEKYYEINYQNAKKQHLQLTENILILGGDEELLRQMYIDSMKVLRQERQNILYKLYMIEDQETRLQLRQEELLEQEKKLDSINIVLEEQNILIKRQKKTLKENLKYIENQKRKIAKLKATYRQQLKNIDKIKAKLSEKQNELDQKKKKLNNLDKELIKSLKQIKSQSDYIKLGLLIFVVLIATILILYIKNREAQKIKEQNKIIKQKNEEILQINDELEQHQQIISEQNKLLSTQIREITSSINYARRIQLALFPIKEILDHNFKENFILYRPKDIVSGDFYWFRKIDNKIIVAVADCTGHGVPGAFMSVLGMTYLSEITNIYSDKANVILEMLREKLINSLEKDIDADNVQIKDGMDIAIAIIDKKERIIHFAGAYNSLLIISDKTQMQEIKGDLMPVGHYFQFDKYKTFTEKSIKYNKGDRIYLFSDGYKDQFGGKNGRKLTKKRFYNLIASIQKHKMAEQKIYLNNFFEEWMKGSKLGQIDDVLVVGIELS